jgi:hypothetical protein
MADGFDKRPGQAPLPFVSPKAAALHAGRLKAIRPEPNGKWELYDLVSDPMESKDLAGDRPDELARLVELFHSWKSDAAQSRAR